MSCQALDGGIILNIYISNGVLIWIVDRFGKSLKTPECPHPHTESVSGALYGNFSAELVILALLVII